MSFLSEFDRQNSIGTPQGLAFWLAGHADALRKLIEAGDNLLISARETVDAVETEHKWRPASLDQDADQFERARAELDGVSPP